MRRISLYTAIASSVFATSILLHAEKAQAQTGWYAQCREIAEQYANEIATPGSPEWLQAKLDFFDGACRGEPSGPPTNEYQVYLDNYCSASGKCYLSGW